MLFLNCVSELSRKLKSEHPTFCMQTRGKVAGNSGDWSTHTPGAYVQACFPNSFFSM